MIVDGFAAVALVAPAAAAAACAVTQSPLGSRRYGSSRAVEVARP